MFDYGFHENDPHQSSYQHPQIDREGRSQLKIRCILDSQTSSPHYVDSLQISYLHIYISHNLVIFDVKFDNTSSLLYQQPIHIIPQLTLRCTTFFDLL